MARLELYSPFDVQKELAVSCKEKRRGRKWSRAALSEYSTVPASTIKRFETTGKISLQQFLLLWHTLDELERVRSLTKPVRTTPVSIEDVVD